MLVIFIIPLFSHEASENSENSENENTQNNENTQSQEQTNGEEKSETEEKDTFNINDYKDQAYINMEFLGLDLSKIPQQNLNDWTVYIIPILYIISTFISMRITTSMQDNKKKTDKIIDITEEKDKKEEEKSEMEEAMAQSNKMMSWMMPIMSVSISLVAPLGLALYWLVNNVLMILERLVLSKMINCNNKILTKKTGI